MKVLAASDVHGNHSVYEWLVHEARNADLVVLAGDLLGCADGFASVEEAQRKDAASICRILEKVYCPAYYIMGNDDLVELDANSHKVKSLHACRYDVGPWNLVGCQYSLPFMDGTYEKPEQAIRNDLLDLWEFVDARTVLVTHNPAYGILDVGVLNEHAGRGGAEESNPWERKDNKSLIGGMLGFGIGGFVGLSVGSFVEKERWETVRIEPPNGLMQLRR